jgi:predicted  nucleic acid-binding Zn-ribbon protein
MSTSPSWFDQEKFSRLVKKVGPKSPVAPSAPAVVTRAAAPRPPEKETRRLQRSMEGSSRGSSPAPSPKSSQALRPPRSGSDTPIRATPAESEKKSDSSNFPAALPVPEPRSVSPLARRTTSLPNLKPIFEYETPAPRLSQSQALRGASAPPQIPPQVPEIEEPAGSAETEENDEPEAGSSTEDVSPAWPAMPSSDEETSPADEEEESGIPGEKEDQLAQLSLAIRERDEARNEVGLLRAQLLQADEIIQATALPPGSGQEELSRMMDERDSARRDYANLREQFETLKHEQSRSAARREEETEPKTQSGGLHDMVEKLQSELNLVQSQLNQSRDEASMAQRGLALSQKALQETRDALRETSEGSTSTRSAVENLKHENATLEQENRQLQTRCDQLERELNSAKGKLGEQG